LTWGSQEKDQAAKEFRPSDKQAILYVDRECPLDPETQIFVLIDGFEEGGTIPESFFKCEFEPGQHKIICRTEADTETIIQVEAGKLYFLRQESTWGFHLARCKLRQVDEQTRMKGVRKCRLLLPPTRPE
jgi:hypothetical protein